MAQGTSLNPPRELAIILEKWASLAKGATLFEARAVNTEGWNEHVRAVRLVEEVDRILQSIEDAGRNVDHYRRWRTSWLTGLFSPTLKWDAGLPHTTVVFERGLIDQLYALADVVDGDIERYRISVDSRRDSIEALDAIIDALGDDSSLIEMEKRYIYALVNAVRESLSEASVFGSFDLARKIHELVGYLNILASDLDNRGNPTLADRFRAAARKVRPFVVGSTIAVAGAIDVAANLKQLGN